MLLGVGNDVQKQLSLRVNEPHGESSDGAPVGPLTIFARKFILHRHIDGNGLAFDGRCVSVPTSSFKKVDAYALAVLVHPPHQTRRVMVTKICAGYSIVQRMV